MLGFPPGKSEKLRTGHPRKSHPVYFASSPCRWISMNIRGAQGYHKDAAHTGPLHEGTARLRDISHGLHEVSPWRVLMWQCYCINAIMVELSGNWSLHLSHHPHRSGRLHSSSSPPCSSLISRRCRRTPFFAFESRAHLPRRGSCPIPASTNRPLLASLRALTKPRAGSCPRAARVFPWRPSPTCGQQQVANGKDRSDNGQARKHSMSQRHAAGCSSASMSALKSPGHS